MNQTHGVQRSPQAVSAASILIAIVLAAVVAGCASVPESFDATSTTVDVSESAGFPDLAALDLPDNPEPIDPLQAP